MNNKPGYYRFTPFCLLLLAASCSVFRPGTTSGTEQEAFATAPVSRTNSSGPNSGNTPARARSARNGADPRFLNDISTDAADDHDAPGTLSSPADDPSGRDARTGRNGRKPSRKRAAVAPDRESGSPAPADDLSVLQLKYSMLTNTPVEKLRNPRLLEFMDEWYGVPYRYGGSGKTGIDCSAFAHELMTEVYDVSPFPRISRDQYSASRKIRKKDLKEGDLVFFHTLGRGHTVTHVGVYLYNNRFIHASVSGVQINDLEEGYYATHYVGAGRVR